MTTKTQVPKGLKPFYFHGLRLDWRAEEKEVVTDCPFCGRENKLSINKENSKWNCFVCEAGGNQYDFIRKLYDLAKGMDVKYLPLALNRKLKTETLKFWGVVPSPLFRDDWLLPGYNSKGSLVQLYRYTKTSKGRAVLSCPEVSGLQLFGMNLYDKLKSVVYLCEGPWDAMRLWEVLRFHKEVDSKIKKTRNPKLSLLSGANILAVPGCKNFKDAWNPVFKGKKVFLVYDNDHPKVNRVTNKTIPPEGTAGMRRASSILGNVPETINFLNWGADGYDPKIPDKYDVRDHFSNGHASSESLQSLFDRFNPVPNDWLGDEDSNGLADSKIRPKECTKWRTLSNAWRKAMKWTDGLDVALSVMLATSASTRLPGDQLWFKIIGPASCGKSSLCEALSVNREYVMAKSTIRGFHSGFKTDREGSEDHSLVSKLYDKTLVVKDGDTLMSAPNLAQILGEGRDIYDGVSRSDYRNATARTYEGLRMTWILCGTTSIKSIDQSDLGERFLDCVIMDRIDPELEDEILLRVVDREDRNASLGHDGGSSKLYDPEYKRAMELTGGYVDYLRENILDLLKNNLLSLESKIFITNHAKFVAYMRARPSKKQEEYVEREFSPRLTSQLTRLTKCLGVVLNKPSADDPEVMRRIAKIALDTSKGLTFDIVTYIKGKGTEGADAKAIARHCTIAETTNAGLLKFLKRIEVLRQARKKVKGVNPRLRWFLTDRFEKLYDYVTNGSN